MRTTCSGCGEPRTPEDIAAHRMCQHCRNTYPNPVIVAQTELYAMFHDEDPNADLPTHVRPNWGGWPTMPLEHYQPNPRDPELALTKHKVCTAFLLAHQAVHPAAHLGTEGGITCYTCRPELAP